MPETPELDEVTFELPDVPMREGEDALRAGMNLEDARRKEATLAELRAEVKRLEGTGLGEMASRFARSPSARRRQISVRKEVERLQKLTFYRKDIGRWEGPSAPATLINLNPVKLILTGQLGSYHVPPAGEGLHAINLKFRGRTFPSSYMTFRTPAVWIKITGTQSDTMIGVDTAAVQADSISPLGLAHQFYSHYVEGSPDAQYMGGIIIFEGDMHTLDENRLKRSDRSVWVPKLEITLDGLGDVVYTVEERKLDELMEQALERQRAYAEMMVTEGHNLATSQSDIERNQLSPSHRIWHNFALDRGYLEKPYSWASSRLQNSPLTQVVACPDCGTRQNDPSQFFCTNCNSPFDALKAFLAGKTVSPDRLAMYEGEEWDAIVKENDRRKAKIAMLQTPDEIKEEVKAKVNKPKKADEKKD